MKELFKYLGIQTESEMLLWLGKMPHLWSYPHYPSPQTTGFYHSSDEGGNDNTSSIYVFLEGKRLSFHFKNGKLDQILAPTNSMVYL